MKDFNMEIKTDGGAISLYPLYFTRELLFSIKAGQPLLFLDKALKLSNYATKFKTIPKAEFDFSKYYPIISKRLSKKIHTITQCYLRDQKIATIFEAKSIKLVLNNPFQLFHRNELIYNSTDFAPSNIKAIQAIQDLSNSSSTKVDIFNADTVATVTLLYSNKVSNLDCIICAAHSFRKAETKYTVSVKGKIFMTDDNSSGIYKITSEKSNYGFAELLYKVNPQTLQLEKVDRPMARDIKRLATINILDRCLYQ